jgi:hypothetical protein
MVDTNDEESLVSTRNMASHKRCLLLLFVPWMIGVAVGCGSTDPDDDRSDDSADASPTNPDPGDDGGIAPDGGPGSDAEVPPGKDGGSSDGGEPTGPSGWSVEGQLTPAGGAASGESLELEGQLNVGPAGDELKSSEGTWSMDPGAFRLRE